jgi:hypothetical protein
MKGTRIDAFGGARDVASSVLQRTLMACEGGRSWAPPAPRGRFEGKLLLAAGAAATLLAPVHPGDTGRSVRDGGVDVLIPGRRIEKVIAR